jgi:hypothetical protein
MAAKCVLEPGICRENTPPKKRLFCPVFAPFRAVLAPF